jgi:membrane fusion protein, multidrug efflux system
MNLQSATPRRFLRAFGLMLLCYLLVATTLGCHRGQAPAPPTPPIIPVAHPIQRQVTDYVDYTGRLDAVQSVGIRARVTGYLMKMPFQEGAEVKAGDLLFEIDPRPYKAMVDQAQSQVTLYQASYKLAKITYERDLATNANTPAVSAQQIDQDKASVEQADAQIKAAQAVLEAYKLNLSFCQVRSPIDGQVSRYYYTLGNLVNQDQTLLTTVVSLDPMYAYFDVDERTVLRVRQAINAGKIKPRANTNEIPVLMGLEGEDDYPHRGSINFVNNAVNPSTATIAARGVFPNPLPEGKVEWAAGAAVGLFAHQVAPSTRRLMSPGMFVRIRLPIGEPHPALLIADQAIGSDQGLRFVYVVDADHKVQYRRVTTGPEQPDGLRVVEGVKTDDWVVVGALQQVRPRLTVEPEEMSMESLGTPAGQAPGTAPRKPQPPPPGHAQDKGTK